MKCNSCGENNPSENRFCDRCGKALEATAGAEPVAMSTVTETSVNAPHITTSASEAPLDLLQIDLKAWAGLRWLFATDYATLRLTKDQLLHDVKKLWASPVYSVIVKIFSFGFDIYSSMVVNSGTTNLRTISNIRIWSLNWVAWRGSFLVVMSSGFPSIYAFSGSQKAEVQRFIDATMRAVAEAKFAVKNQGA